MNQSRQSLRLNIGFLINQSVGFSRDFYFDLDSLFIEPDLQLKNFSGSTRITRTPQGLLVQADVHAFIESECVRCLVKFDQPLNTEFTELFTFSQRSTSDSELIVPEEGYIDLGPLVREYLVLEIPIKTLCHPDCLGICAVCGEPQGEQFHVHEVDSGDPRMAVLKTLLDNQSTE